MYIYICIQIYYAHIQIYVHSAYLHNEKDCVLYNVHICNVLCMHAFYSAHFLPSGFFEKKGKILDFCAQLFKVKHLLNDPASDAAIFCFYIFFSLKSSTWFIFIVCWSINTMNLIKNKWKNKTLGHPICKNFSNSQKTKKILTKYICTSVTLFLISEISTYFWCKNFSYLILV